MLPGSRRRGSGSRVLPGRAVLASRPSQGAGACLWLVAWLGEDAERAAKLLSVQLIVNEKSQNLRRLQAQRNELNAKGMAPLLSSLCGAP